MIVCKYHSIQISILGYKKQIRVGKRQQKKKNSHTLPPLPIHMFGPNKRVVNHYLRSLVKKKHRVLVIDTKHLGSSKCLVKVVRRNNVYVCGTDEGLASAARRIGIQNVAEGWSGEALDKWKNVKFDLIFLDYCGTPDGTDFFNPAEDMARASAMLKRDGVLAVTFSKRCGHLMTKCVDMTPPCLWIQRTYEYCDTSPMIMVAYSAFPLPKIGEALGLKKGSVVRVGKWFGKIEKVYLNGVKLEHVKKNWGVYVPVKGEEDWEEPFSSVV